MATATTPDRPKAAGTLRERSVDWLSRMVFNQLGGIAFGDWCRLIRENHFRVDPIFWPKAALVTALSLVNSARGKIEAGRFGRELDDVEVRPPLFVLGHWRGGTTHLHNLIALDGRFAYPNLYEVNNPHTFLSAGPRHYDLVDRLLPSTRVIDNMAIGSRLPAEDEFATCLMSLRSPYMWAFGRNQANYRKYLTFREAPEADVDRWKAALILFLKKLTLRHGRPLALKSPPHTCRIALLLGMFPDARFLHIRRDPFAVYRSTLHMVGSLSARPQFQAIEGMDLGEMILDRYETMYDVYFEERGLIPRGRLHELSFEDLERDPIGELRTAYDAIGLDGFERALPGLEAYIAGQADYRKNELRPLDPELRRRIAGRWRRSFDEWGYPRD